MRVIKRTTVVPLNDGRIIKSKQKERGFLPPVSITPEELKKTPLS